MCMSELAHIDRAHDMKFQHRTGPCRNGSFIPFEAESFDAECHSHVLLETFMFVRVRLRMRVRVRARQ